MLGPLLLLVDVVLAVGGLLALYLVPTFLAVQRRPTMAHLVIAVDVLLGWTIAGWFAALVLSLALPRARALGAQIPVATPVAPPPIPTGQAVIDPITPGKEIVWAGGLPDTADHSADFVRSPLRVCVLAFVSPVTYELWWFWQFFKLAKREDFPNARKFWWIFLPIYGWVVTSRIFHDLEARLRTKMAVAFSAQTAMAMVIASHVSGGLSNRLHDPAAFLAFALSGVFIAAAIYLIQRASNSYLRATYPDRNTNGMSWGEIVATILGILFFGLVILGSLAPS